jgi:hypothetical protein
MTARPDPDALLVALVLLPGTYSRNRFFDLYTDPEARAVRNRARLLRSIVVDIACGEAGRRGRIVKTSELPGGRTELSYEVPALNLKRTTTLSPLEMSVVRYAVARRMGPLEALAADDPDRLRIESVLGRLGPSLPEPGGSEPMEEGLSSA